MKRRTDAPEVICHAFFNHQLLSVVGRLLGLSILSSIFTYYGMVIFIYRGAAMASQVIF